jgi:uncharacterized membrane protein (DUF4010 family)
VVYDAAVEAYENHISLATALAVGLLVGLEREQSRPPRPGAAFGGVRTYPIFALIGALATMLETSSMWLPLIALLGVFALVSISYAADVKRHDDHGVTTESSIVATYLLGALATSRGVLEPMADRLVLVAGLGVVLTFLLSSKPWFHAFAEKVSRDDLFATLKFLIVAVIVLPLLPDRDMGPLGALNPRTLGLLVVTISGLSFIGYVAMRLLGTRRGLLVGAALGGLVSSTAVTLSFSNRTKETPELAPVAAGAIAVAWTIMLVRVAVLCAVVEPSVLRVLAVPLAAATVGTLAGLALTFRRGDADVAAVEVKNPFELGSAIKVTVVFAIVLFVTKAATHYLGDRGLYLASALGGTTDVDAVTVSTAKLAAGETITAATATIAIGIACALNTLVKTGLAMFIGGSVLGRRVALTAVLAIVAGGVALAVVAAV